MSRPGIESVLALFGTAGAAATAEATTGATAEGMGAVARAVETMEPTGSVGRTGGKRKGEKDGKRAGFAEARRAVAARGRRVDRCMVVGCEGRCSDDGFRYRLSFWLLMCSLRGESKRVDMGGEFVGLLVTEVELALYKS